MIIGTLRARCWAQYLVLLIALGSSVVQAAETVTIEAGKKRELKRQIDHFVHSVVVSYAYESLERWNTPVCPLVAGLTGDRGEFVLSRISQIATAARVPLAGEHCKPNFFVVVTSEPDLLIEKWVRRSPKMVNTCNGYGYVREFLHSHAPVRVWYNAQFQTVDGAALSVDSGGLDVAGLALRGCTVSDSLPSSTRLRLSQVQSLSSVVLVVDSTQTTKVNIGQLADYAAMAGLAQVRLGANADAAPTILSLFGPRQAQAQGVTAWDQSLLHALYNSDQSSVLQVSTIETRMLDQIGR